MAVALAAAAAFVMKHLSSIAVPPELGVPRSERVVSEGSSPSRFQNLAKHLGVRGAVSATPRPSPDPSPLARQIREEADALYSSSNQEGDARLERLAENLNSTSALELTRLALNPAESQNERFLSVYVIGLRASRFTKELMQIAESRPHESSQTEAELALRLQAMSALDGLAAMEPGLTKSIFQRIESSHTNPLLRKVARLGMRSVREGSPLIQKYLDMEMSEILDESN